MTSLFENATEGIILTDGAAKIVLLNPAAEAIFGYAASELIGSRIERLLPVRTQEKHVKLRDHFYQHPQNRTMGSGRDLYARKKNGEEFPVEVSLSHYRQKNEMYVIAFVVDISLRKQAEANMIRQQKELEKITNDIRKLNTELEIKVEERTQILKEALTKLEQSQIELREALDKERQLNEIKSRFVSMASHEFRTPLSSVLSSASLLAKYTQAEEQEKRNKHINRIKDSVKHLNEILEDFLSLGRLDENKEMVSISSFDLEELLMETAEELKPVLKKGQEVIVQHQGERSVHSDKRLIKNMLINLSSNAAKFSGENSAITIHSLVDNRGIILKVVDRGIGIPENDQQHLFSSFFRASNATNIQGTGLGLHIVKRYADLLRGTVHLQSKLDEGTTITIKLPAKA
ncbi:MAG: PAS domain S-box protein [Terrimonas sp.]|nr:PAS domain S-box protein [Terrimonas sp.]